LSPDATIDDDLELLAGLIGRSLCSPAARDAAASLIDAFGGLAGVAAADEAALRRAGLARAAVADLRRVRALGIAMARAEACHRPVLSSWSALVAYLRAALAHAPREQFRTLYLDKRNILIRAEWWADGTVDHAPVYPREVVRRALELSASALILVHNHPSGDPTPSRADIDMTRKIIDAARVFDIEVHDHVVVAREGTTSFRALGLM
jgi:DNA repair protein RadC